MPAPIRSRLYREFLTLALHRRFTHAAGIALLICYAEAILIGDWSSLLWSWFPLGKAGIRTLLLFLSPLLVFVLRVAQLHCGRRSTPSSFQTFKHYLYRRDVLETSFCYILSALLFSEVYIWSVSKGANLNWVIQGRSWERQRLNERPIYLRSLYLGLALLQTTLHLGFDYDMIRITVSSPYSARSLNEQPRVPANPVEQMKSRVLGLLREIGAISLVSVILGPIFYSLTVRKTAWQTSLACARFLGWDIPGAAEISYVPPYHYTLIFRSLVSGFCLLLLWQGSNLAFDAYVAQEPLKRGQPLTQESNDPNGSLINGLKSRKQVVKTFAFWELVKISKQYPERRVTIFKDIDRPGGPAWSQISTECLKIIQEITIRISTHQKGITQQQHPAIDPSQLQSLPRLGAPLKEEPVLLNPPPPSTRRERVERQVGSFAKSYGNSPQPGSPSQYLETARRNLIPQAYQQTVTVQKAQSTFSTSMTNALHWQIATPFRQTFARRLMSIVFAQPYSDLQIIVYAIISLTTLATNSIQEDSFGKVARDIPLLVRTFVGAYQALDGFTRTLAPHWTDVGFSEGNRKVEDVEIGLGERELEVARRIAGMGQKG